jgi:hypothetical protein
MKRLVIGALLAGALSLVTAAPIAVTLPSAVSLQTYHGTAPLNAGQLDADEVLWLVREQAHDGLQAWYLFYDPLNPHRLRATVDFGAPIVAVFSTRETLTNSQAAWQVDIDGDAVLDDYAWRPLMGLEAGDTLSWTLGGTQLSLDWRADDPGDHVRVLVQVAPDTQAVPEPASAALVLAGLAAAAAVRRRRA